MKTALTNYYMNKASEILEKEFGNNLQIAVKVEGINKNKDVTLKFGISDGKDFLSVFGIVTLRKDDIVYLADSEGLIKTNFRDWVHMTTEGINRE